jgi:O-succinylbenzoic acid--CoA ligase
MTELSIFAAARTAPERIALVTDAADYTYGQLATLAASRAAALAPLPGAVLLKPRLDLDSLLWLYAALATGTPFLVLPHSASALECRRMQHLTGAREMPILRASTRESPSTPRVERTIDPQKPYAFLPTSGSSGLPKIVESSRRAALASAAASAQNLGIDPQERWLLCLPLSHMGGLSIVIRMLVARRTVVLFPAGDAGLLAGAARLGRCIDAKAVTIVSLVPALLDRLLESGFRPSPSLRAVLLGGAGCAAALAERAWQARVPLVTSYGLTETGSQVLARPYAERYDPLPLHAGIVSSGRPLSGVEIKLVGSRIAIKAAALLTAYVPGVAPAVDADGWFLSNDRGIFGPRGEWYILGRTDLVIITGGENVDPIEVERALCALPGIENACVFGVPCAEFGQRVVAVIVPAPGFDASDPARMNTALGPALARAKIPRRYVFAPALPLTVSGKLDRAACAAQFGASTCAAAQ